MKEIIVDNFAGGGGASTGIEMAIGRSVDIAINHDVNAVAMHTTNHPDTLHYCESVFDIDPKQATAGNPVGLAWFSPDCRHFSKAKGSKPVAREIRGLAWIVLRWALAVRPRVMMLENVEEFKTWGPLLVDENGDQRPDPKRAGETFSAFVGMLGAGIDAGHPALNEACDFLGIEPSSSDALRLINGLGYEVDSREMRACDYGAPTIRKRFFMVMRCDGQSVTWPEPSHGDPKSLGVLNGVLKPWRTAAECIDWSLDCPSIFERKRPLATNTLKRIARGIQRFVIDNPSPFIVKCNHTSTRTKYDCFRGQSLAEPMQTITKTHGYAIAVPKVAPFVARQFGASVGHRADEPSATITAGGGGKSQLCAATLIQMGYGERPGQSPRVLQLEKPLGTITAGGGKFAVVAANLVKHFGGNYTGPGVAMDEPVHSVTTVDHHALVTSHLVMLRGTCKDGRVVDAPAPGLTAGGLHVGNVETYLAVDEYDEQRAEQVSAFLREYCGDDYREFVTVEGVTYRIVDIGMRMLQPHELYRAQGFPDWYIIDQDYRGVKYAKDKQVARCGNAVPPPFAEALVRANLPEMCIFKEEIAA
ncbi:DNA cytosine methyltransferase [Buttiauxella sp. B2]|uniref:DNA cytosine methyltransferase n=1 Tax=Buttiauxella sp. B2 TaxID=2587812 RepID=UPI00111EBC3D|nr:DNA cytosine methyltransferase [Buttiauxella sp. B2]TNV14929.1 DNA cytosine methyltransferase [Buttiauxella sp. B2]